MERVQRSWRELIFQKIVAYNNFRDMAMDSTRVRPLDILAKNTRVTEDVITHNKTEYSSHALAEVVDGKHKNDWILITRSRTGK